jgi:hypothetical protein
MKITTEELGAALLWLRNHYDVGKPEHKEYVLKVIDKVLLSDDNINTWVRICDTQHFREKYLPKGGSRCK